MCPHPGQKSNFQSSYHQPKNLNDVKGHAVCLIKKLTFDALKEIASELQKEDWNFSLNPCDENSNWNTPPSDAMYNNSVICNCSFPGGVCHIEKIILKGQSLQGVLRPSLAKLPYIKAIDLARNCLSGTIPLEWVPTKLEYISVRVNRLSGPIPGYLGNLKILVRMMLSSCNLVGKIPDYIANMTALQILDLSFNKLEGEVPDLERLTNLKNMYLTSNFLSGPVQDWITSRDTNIKPDKYSFPSTPIICGDSVHQQFLLNLVTGEKELDIKFGLHLIQFMRKV